MLLNTKDQRLPNLNKKQSEFIQAEKVDVSEKAKEKIRMQMVNWLIDNKKGNLINSEQIYWLEEVNKINDNHGLIIAWIDYFVEYC